MSATSNYHAELRAELARLESSQLANPSEYKSERIDRLRERLGIEDEDDSCS